MLHDYNKQGNKAKQCFHWIYKPIGSYIQKVVRFIFLKIDENAKNLIRECETKNVGADLEVVT